MGKKDSSTRKGPVAGLTAYGDHIFVPVADSRVYSGLFVSSTLFLSSKWPGLEDKLHDCSKSVAYSGNEKKSRVSGL